MTEEQQRELEQMFAAMGTSGGKIVIGQVVGTQTNYIAVNRPENSKSQEQTEDISSETSDKTYSPESAPDPDHTEINIFAPTLHLKKLFEGEWFLSLCTNKALNNKDWTDKFVTALMNSEYATYIAKQWAKPQKIQTIKGNIVGLLSDSGLLKGSKLSIARTILNISQYERNEEKKKSVSTFANYMGKGKKEPYADWVKKYIGASIKGL